MSNSASGPGSVWTRTRELSPRRRRRWFWYLGSLVLLAYLAPYVVAWTPLRNWLLHNALRPLNTQPTIQALSLGWLSPIEAQGISVRPPASPPVVQVDELKTAQPLWQLLLMPSSQVQLSLQRPQFHLAVTQQGTNLHALLPSGNQGAPKPPRRRVQIEVVDGAFVWSTGTTDRQWQTGPFDFVMAIEPSSGQQHQGALVVAPGQPLRKVELSRGMYHDVLKYVHPLFADVVQVSGRLSLTLSQCRLPLADRPGERQNAALPSPLAGATIEGTLDLHRVSLGPGPLVAELAGLFDLPAEVALVQESHVSFALQHGRVQHDPLEFSLGPLQVVTTGSVGLDQTLDLTAELRLAPDAMPDADQPLLRALAQRTLRVPIQGTLSRPCVDLRSLGRDNLALLAGVIDALAERRRRKQQSDQAPEPDRSQAPHPDLPRIRRMLERLKRTRAEP